MVTRPELFGLDALKKQALQKNKMMNPEERDRIGSTGIFESGKDLFDQRKIFQELNPEQSLGTDAFRAVAERYTDTPTTDFSLYGRMQPEGENLQEEIQNMSDPLFRTLLKGGQFGEAGQKKLDKIYSTGGEYRFQDAYDEREELTDNLNLGNFSSIDSLLKAQRLLETKEIDYGEKFAKSDLKSLATGALFLDKNQKIPFYSDKTSPIDMPSYRQQIEKDFGKTQGNIILGEDSTVYAEYSSKEKALSDNNFLSNVKAVKSDNDFYGAGMQMNVAGVVRLNGFERDGKFYVPLTTLDEAQKAYLTNTISRQDRLNIAGQALGLAEIAATPVQGLYKGVFMAFGKSIDIAFNEAGKLTTQSLKALEKLKTSPTKIKQLENNARLRIMYSKSQKKSITKSAPTVQSTAKLVTPLVDGSKSYAQNVTDIAKALEGQKVHGGKPGEAFSFVNPEGAYFRKAVQKEYFKQNQLSVKQYEKYLKSMIDNKGRVDLPENFYAGLKREEFESFKAFDNVRREIPNLKTARANLETQGYSKTDFKNAAQNQKIYTMSPEDYAAFRAKQAGYRSANYSGSKQEARVLNLEKYEMKLSDREQSIFDQVNFVWKTDTSVAIKNNKDLQKVILNNKDIVSDLSYRVLNSGKIAKSNSKVTKDRLTNTEFKPESYTQTFYETDHIMPVELASQAGVNALRNLQTLPKTLNNDFKKPFDVYIAKLLKQDNIDQKDIDNIKEIVKQAEELGVTLYIDEPAKFGFDKKLVGAPYNELAEVGVAPYIKQTENIINRYSPGANLRELNLNPTRGNSMGGKPISREKFQTPGFTNDSEEERMKRAVEEGKIPGTINYAVKQALNPVQDQIRSVYEERLQPYFDSPMKYLTLEKKQLEKELSDRLNPPSPVKFKFSELPRLITESPITQALTTDPRVVGLETIEFIYNSLRKGVENDIEMKEKFPKIYKMNELTKVKGPGPFSPKEEDYISAIDEINRAAETGLTNFAYNVGDLLFSIPDALLPTEFTDELKRRYEKTDLARPETFVGEIAAVALEFGIPGGIAFKLINRFRKFTAARTGGKLNLFAQETYALEGLPKLGVQISNVFKRVGTGAISFGAGDFIAGGPYNTISEMFDDPLLTSKYVGQYEDTSNLSGKERVVANFKNRLRFGAEGAMIGGLFPLVGPVLGTIGKNVLLKPALFLGGGALKIADTVAIKPATYLASLDPVVIPGIARGTGAFAKFLGQDVVARLAATAATGGKAFVPSLKGNFGQLPEFSKWRMFDVTSNDPLERGLKKVDNFLKWFRDSGNQALYGFNLSGGAERFIKAKSREIEKYLDSIERKAYDLANGFLGRYNKGFTSPAGESQMLEQVFEYLRGNLKLSKIQPELQEMSKVLKDEFNALKQAYFKELPEGSGLRAALESNLDKYMRMSFSTFTNPKFAPDAKIVEQATDFMVNIINRNGDFLEAAIKGVSPTAQTAAVREFARKNVENIINIGKREGADPINALNTINREILRGDDVFLQTGEELPKVIRNLLGQEKSLRNSVMMTTGSLVSQTANIRSFKEFARHGLENGYLFTSRAEALAAGVMDPKPIRELPGLGPMQDLVTADKDGPVGLFASNELKQTIEGTGGMLDSLLQNSFYQSLIAYKAAVQTGKTVFSPATQTRNFGSAGFFPAHVGHIGGGASVTDAFKITLDDIFGAGRTVNEADLIKRISRKIELGVLDENIVASELGAILKDIKAGKLQSLGKLAERAENTKFYKQATRVYAGGDNVWKWYGHEYYMSQLKGAFRNVDDVKRFFEDIHGIEFNTKNIMTGATKSLDEGIEEAAAFLLRETYPTYSKVPEFIKAIRKLPIGNFVSFTSEILRTGFSTSAIAMKHIASDNQALREMGYRMLSGQAITLGGMTAGAVGLGHALTNVTPTQIDVYKQYFAPEYMQYSTLIPVTNHKDGSFKVFDLSRYNPYDIIVSSAKELMKVAERQNYSTDVATLKEQLSNLDPSSDEAKAVRKQIKDLKVRIAMNQKLDSDKIETNNLKTYLNAVGPLYNAVTGTFFGIPIGAEAFIEAYTGKTRQGSPIWSTGMVPSEIFDRAMGHFFKTIEPGIISSGRKLFYSVRGDVSGVGQPLEIDTEMFKLMGGSNVTVDVLGSLDFKITDFQKSFREARVAKDYFSVENFKSRGPEQLVKEYREQNEQAFRAQYEFYKAATAAIDSGLITRNQVVRSLTNRISPGSETVPEKVRALMQGRYNALSYGPEGLKSRREKIIRNDPDLDTRRYSLQYFLPFGALEKEKRFWQFKRFEDFEKKPEREQQSAIPQPFEGTPTAQAAEPPVPPLADTPDPVVAPQVPNVDQATGLTTTETALLSPGEQAIRRRQRGIA